MSTRLDDMISAARERDLDVDGAWDVARSERVREGALRRRDGRVRRDRALRRGLLVASGAGLLVLALLRAASSAPGAPALAATTETVAPAATSEALASRSLSDAGYARD
jgi:hypothetical protein